MIIHDSFIISSGLETLIRKYYTIETIEFHSSQNIDDLEDIDKYDLVFSPHQLKSQLHSLKQEMKCPLVALTNSQLKHSSSLIFDDFLDIDAREKDICMLLDKYLSGSNSKADKEGAVLTSREEEVLKCIASGCSNKQTAEDLFISTHTVISHRKNITEKTGIKSVSGLTIYAILNKLIEPGLID